ncbi:spore germination protein, partial [Paenibacillus sp. MCAF20]
MNRTEGSEDDRLGTDIKQHAERLSGIFSDTPDLILRHFRIKQTNEKAILVYFEGLTDKNSINHDVLLPLQLHEGCGTPGGELITTVGYIDPVVSWSEIEKKLLQGSSLLFVEGRTEAFAMDTKGWPQRAIEDPQLESSLKGAHQGFVETGGQNIALLRRYIPNRELKIKRLLVGKRGQTPISIVYLEDVVNADFLADLEKRIQAIKTDVIINTGELSDFIEDNPRSLFPQFIATERPDAAASQILQGRCIV